MSLFRKAAESYRRAELKDKLVVLMLAGIMFISATIALTARWILVSSLTRELEMRGSAIAHSVGERGASYILDHDIPRLLSLIFDEARLHERKHLVSYIFIQDRHGVVLCHTLTKKLPAALMENVVPEGQDESIKLMHLDDQQVYDIAMPIKEGLYRIGTVHVGLSKGHIDSLIAKLRMAFLGFISGVVLIAMYVSNRLSTHLTRPIRRLTRLADEISRGNFDIPLETVSAGLEWSKRDCPAYQNTDLPCWHFDLTADDAEAADAEAYRHCKNCMFYKHRPGDEVVQLGDSFRNMVWSIKLYRHRLRESEEKYRSLFDSGPDPIFVVDCATAEIIDANPRASEVYLYEREAMRGMSFEALAPGGFEMCLDYFQEGSGCKYYPKLLHYKRGNDPFYVNMHACPISYRGRHAIIIAITDITEMIEKDAQLIQAGKMKALGEMSAGIAHELNQPLNAIKMGSEYLAMMDESGMEVPPEQRLEVMEEISTQVDRAAEIINTLRSFGRKSDLIRELVDLNDPLRKVLTILRRQFELENIRFELSLAPGLPPVLAHDNRLQQVLFNLVTNAKDAINEKSEPHESNSSRTIFLRTCQCGDRVQVEVEDTGVGMSSQVRDKVFEPFFTTKDTGQGMGIGLAISYGIVKDYGGELAIESQLGQGTLFRLSFPVALPKQEGDND